VRLRSPLIWFAALGGLGWAVSYLFGGPETSAGGLIVGLGSLLLLSVWAIEIGLRIRERRQRRSASRQV